jgi:hypothetical protein
MSARRQEPPAWAPALAGALQEQGAGALQEQVPPEQGEQPGPGPALAEQPPRGQEQGAGALQEQVPPEQGEQPGPAAARHQHRLPL